jgi:hypothetical protein
MLAQQHDEHECSPTGGCKRKTLLSQALAAIAQDEFTRQGLNSEPLMLLMLLLDDSTLQSQTPVGRHLLRALRHLGVTGGSNEQERRQLLNEVHDFFLGSDDYWEGLHAQSRKIEREFDDLKKGKKDDVMVAFKAQAFERGHISSCPSVLQLVYANNARNHAIMGR